nr:MAG TPA_asm: hypothetical protein [Caudoviricetes sp.]
MFTCKSIHLTQSLLPYYEYIAFVDSYSNSSNSSHLLPSIR